MAKGNSNKIDLWKPNSPIGVWLILTMLVLAAFLPLILSIVGSRSLGASSEASPALDSLLNAFRFTFLQAGISSLLVLILAPFLAICLTQVPEHYYRFSSTLRTLSFCLPSVVVAAGVVLCWGKSGIGTRIFESFGIHVLPEGWLYSQYAVIAANAIMNIPFASLIIARSLKSFDKTSIESARLIGLSPLKTISSVMLPQIIPQILYLAGLSFLLSMGNFGALSILGSSNGAVTLEMGIYQSLFLYADWKAGAIFSIVHTLCAGLVSLIFLAPRDWSRVHDQTAVSANVDPELLKQTISPKLQYGILAIIVSFLFDLMLAAPLLATTLDALRDFNRIFEGSSALIGTVVRSFVQSLTYSVPAGILATLMSWVVVRSHSQYNFLGKPGRSKSILIGVFLTNIVPSMACAFGYFAIISKYPEFRYSSQAIVLLHAIFSLPFIISFLMPIYAQNTKQFFELKFLTGMSQVMWLCKVEWPSVKRYLFIMFIIALSLSMNETSVVTLMGDPESPAMTTTMISLMGHYRFSDSALVSLCLIIITAIALTVFSQSRTTNHGNH